MSGSELSPAARALLDAARDGMAPDPATIRRMRGKVGVAVGVGAGLTLGAKLGIAGIVMALAVGAGVQRTRSASTAEAPRIDLPMTQVESVAPVGRPPVEARDDIEMAAEPMRRPRASVPAAAHAPAALATADLGREVQLIDSAVAALKRGEPARALAMLRLHASETRGAGQLAEDAAAIEVEALCRLHSPSVVAKLDAFEARFPRSAQRSRLTSACTEE